MLAAVAEALPVERGFPSEGESPSERASPPGEVPARPTASREQQSASPDRQAASQPHDRREPETGPLVLVGLSGGPDSLALAAVVAHWVRRGRLRAGAVVVDHGLQAGSAQVAERAAEQARGLGLHPVDVRRVQVRQDGEGPEAAARTARYAALHTAAAEHGAGAILLGHTLDDQAESVLLGLARGSGTRSLSGMPRLRSDGAVSVLRPLLELRRAQTEAICAAERLEPWHDPTNQDQSMLRARVRSTVLPELERQLGPGVAEALARTAAILGPDAELLDRQAAELLERAIAGAGQTGQTDQASHAGRTTQAHRADPGRPAAPHRAEPGHQPGAAVVVLSLSVLQDAPQPLTRRALAQACTGLGAEQPSHERLTALAELAGGRGEAGPVQMAGKVAAYRRRPRRGSRGSGTLELVLQGR